jgi:hypothetical protein
LIDPRWRRRRMPFGAVLGTIIPPVIATPADAVFLHGQATV